MSDQIFRKKSLDRISSPEQLNDYIRVANPGIWMILAAVIILLAGVCVWGIFGHLDTKTEELTEAAKTTEKPTRSRRVKKEVAEEVPAEKPKRGRPRKVKEQEPEVTPKKEAAEVPAEKPKRGRPRKKPVEAAAPEK